MMLAKLERAQSNEKQNKYLTLKTHKEWEQQQTINQQHNNTTLERTAAKALGVLKLIIPSKSSP